MDEEHHHHHHLHVHPYTHVRLKSGTLTNHVIPNYWSRQPPAGLPILFAFVALGDLFWAIAAKDCQFQHRPFSPDNICLFFARNSWLIPRRHLSTAPYHSRIFYVSRHGFPSSLRFLDFFVFVSCVFVCSCVCIPAALSAWTESGHGSGLSFSLLLPFTLPVHTDAPLPLGACVFIACCDQSWRG
ncbi:hypothetical protein SYNPS1DRAFT_30119 [Syncephalis pseudoplumigaleata]|uniref:Uncharacterized protein n=1 Tax=Syncephalis pseudoplumigaleata TaxID=1712513 RepID=A0A4P9YW33_9FUNG|nr:hypothetical protein SYNPS1DRAFT_31803 [Syncephalis pseudoplumigaleata]RKP24114.1 hypothetical protein SYNPS1DRAFT_30119 [Syncephalis pseudoplumigaleata]|eukprot:RKP22590.1 hypothetical protein SYNPS1DRAFT_31803 [Syncephalis pseudoplumigaleata]